MPRVITIPDKFTITVVLPVGKSVHAFTIEGRSAKLIAWVVMHRARIERVGTGLLAFNLGLRNFVPEIREHFPSHQAEPEVAPDDQALTDLAS